MTAYFNTSAIIDPLSLDSKTIPVDTPDSFNPAVLRGEELDTLKITPRESFMGTWFREGDLGFIFGLRGQGKTWFSIGLCRALAQGLPFGPWAVGKPRRILYVDGEMPMDDFRHRLRLLGGVPTGLSLLSHEQCFSRLDLQMNLTDPEHQRRLEHSIKAQGIEVVVIDNLSCLFSGVRENDADEWEKVLPWLFRLRRLKVAVIVMHHANRGGNEMRGTSRREDAAFWVIKLQKDESTVGDHRTRFSTIFSKNRQGTREDTEDLLWTLSPIAEEQLRLDHEPMGKVERLLRLVREGIASNHELAKELNVSTATVTRIAQEAMRQGRLKKEGNKYVVS